MSNLVQRLLSWWQSRKLDEQPVPQEDPVATSSLATVTAIFSLLLMLSLVWALYDEAWGLRPWISYQSDFVERYREVLIDLKPQRGEEEQNIQASPDYGELRQAVEEAESEIEPELAEIEADERLLALQLAAITKTFTTERSRLQAAVYLLETASDAQKEGLESDLEELREGVHLLEIPDAEGVTEPSEYTYEQMEEEFNSLKARQGELQARKVELLRRPTELRRERTAFVDARLTSLTEGQIDGLLREVDNFRIEIKQIHNPELGLVELGLVDRCQSCHVGTLPSLVPDRISLTSDTMGGGSVFTSHPNPRLLQIHDPETLGCSPCHNGNGVATVGTTEAHGQYKHWLWPLHPTENSEAGCLQCHEADRYLEVAMANISTGCGHFIPPRIPKRVVCNVTKRTAIWKSPLLWMRENSFFTRAVWAVTLVKASTRKPNSFGKPREPSSIFSPEKTRPSC
jgi:hypothetical protein